LNSRPHPYQGSWPVFGSGTVIDQPPGGNIRLIETEPQESTAMSIPVRQRLVL
jgi:hypothetical protein